MVVSDLDGEAVPRGLIPRALKTKTVNGIQQKNRENSSGIRDSTALNS
jgi:hypothetical protein